MQQVHTVHRGASPLQKRGSVDGGVKGPKALRQDGRFQDTVAAERRIPATDQQQMIAFEPLRLKGGVESSSDGAVAFGCRRGCQRPGIRKEEQQR